MHDVMISYSSKDKVIADAICNQLESHNIRVWIAPRDMLGRTYLKGIKDGINNASIIVLVFSANSNKSKWVPRELERGVTYAKIIIPFKLEEVTPVSEDIELCTSTQHWIDAISPPIEQNIAKLVNTVSALLQSNNDSFSKLYKDLSPLGQILQLANRWAQHNYEYFVLEGIDNELKSILRIAPRTLKISDENATLFLTIASIHFGGAWLYWQKKISNSKKVIVQLVRILNIPYLRPRLRSLYTLQNFEKNLVEEELRSLNLDDDFKDVFNKYVFTKKMDIYLQKLANHADPQVASKAKIIIEEIEYYNNYGKIIKSPSLPKI